MLQYVIIGCTFIGFLLYNGSLVLGDHSAHEPTIHIPQLFYFSLFTVIFGWPHFIQYVIPFLKLCKKHQLKMFILLNIVNLIIYLNTLEHPYLLADNRHYTFYVWKNFYRGIPLFKYLVSIVYIFGFYCIFKTIYNPYNISFTILFDLCLIISLIFQKLIEVRYFFIPYVLVRLRFKIENIWFLVLEIIYFVILNYVYFTIFVNKDIIWSNYSYPQKLIW